jgi:hypothetical protein
MKNETLSIINPISQNITGFLLNTIPKELLENDVELMDKLIFIYNNYGELDGSSLDGIIDNISILSKILNDFNVQDEEMNNRKLILLQENDCSLSVDDLFPCYKIPDNEVLAEYENIHLQLLGTMPEKDFTEKCQEEEDCSNLNLTDIEENCIQNFGCDE